MGATVIVNMRTVVHKGSGGASISLPDACKTPAPPGPPVPIPYPNVARSSDTAKGSKKVKCDGNPIMLKNKSEFSKSNGDEAGTLKGIASSKNMAQAKFALYSFDVKVECQNVPRLGDPMTTNGNNPNSGHTAEAQPPTVVTPISEHDVKCAIQKCDKEDENGKDYDIQTTKGGKKPMPPRSACGALGSKKHTCVKNTLEKKQKAQCEQTFDMGTDPPAHVPPGSPRPPRGQGRRPDVIVGDISATPRNVNVYDAKFPCGASVKGGKRKGAMPSRDVTGKAYLASKPPGKELSDYQDIAGQGRSEALTPKDCEGEPCGD